MPRENPDEHRATSAERITDFETVAFPETRGWVGELAGSCDLLAYLPPRVAEMLEVNMREEKFEAGQRLIRQGDPGDSLMVIRDGVVRIGSKDANGKRRWIARSGRGQVLGEMALLTGEPRTADVIALKPVRAMVLSAETLHRLAREHPEIGEVLTGIVARRLGSVDHDALAGKTLGGWLIRRRLGKGGMSIVYDAEDRQGRRAALKMMSHRLVYDEGACRQFQREADIIQSFEHPNIVRMYERFAAFHTYFLALEFCEGAPLDEVLKRRGPLPESEARKVIGQAAAGLAYAHRAGVIHRDVKPANVMVARDGTVKLMDFGLARPVAELPASSDAAVVGTPAYMAPEQMEGQSLTTAADLFSFGAVMWEILAGRRLIGNLSFSELFRLHAEWKPPVVRETLPEVSSQLAEIIERCLAKSPEDRRVDLAPLAAWAAPFSLEG
ncbi:MAG: protein kinase [Planctomycetes bacterium]|nr:protein kinase [Planctomycetota bacterium]